MKMQDMLIFQNLNGIINLIIIIKSQKIIMFKIISQHQLLKQTNNHNHNNNSNSSCPQSRRKIKKKFKKNKKKKTKKMLICKL